MAAEARKAAVTRAIQTAIGDNPARGVLTEYARKASTSPSNMSRWYHGDTVPDSDKWPKLEEALGLDRGTFAAIMQQGADIVADEELLAAVRQLGAEMVQLRAEVAALRREVRGPRA